jgi:hypothetical protein
MLSREGRPTPLVDAIAHYGRISKTLHILRLADEPGHRRQIKNQANLREGRHSLARKIFHGRSGPLYQRYQDGMEDQIGVLGLGGYPARCLPKNSVSLATAGVTYSSLSYRSMWVAPSMTTSSLGSAAFSIASRLK